MQTAFPAVLCCPSLVAELLLGGAGLGKVLLSLQPPSWSGDHCHPCPGAPSRLRGVPALPCSCPRWGRGPSSASPAGVRGCAGGWDTWDPTGESCPCGTALQGRGWCWPRAGLFLGPCLCRAALHAALIARVMLSSFFLFQ